MYVLHMNKNIAKISEFTVKREVNGQGHDISILFHNLSSKALNSLTSRYCQKQGHIEGHPKSQDLELFVKSPL